MDRGPAWGEQKLKQLIVEAELLVSQRSVKAVGYFQRDHSKADALQSLHNARSVALPVLSGPGRAQASESS